MGADTGIAAAEASGGSLERRGEIPVSIDRPGPAKARAASGASGVRVEVDGQELARTDVREGELLEDVEARLRLAVGQRGGLR